MAVSFPRVYLYRLFGSTLTQLLSDLAVVYFLLCSYCDFFVCLLCCRFWQNMFVSFHFCGVHLDTGESGDQAMAGAAARLPQQQPALLQCWGVGASGDTCILGVI